MFCNPVLFFSSLLSCTHTHTHTHTPLDVFFFLKLFCFSTFLPSFRSVRCSLPPLLLTGIQHSKSCRFHLIGQTVSDIQQIHIERTDRLPTVNRHRCEQPKAAAVAQKQTLMCGISSTMTAWCKRERHRSDHFWPCICHNIM